MAMIADAVAAADLLGMRVFKISALAHLIRLKGARN